MAKTITFQVNDGQALSNTQSREVTLAQAPVLAGIEVLAIDYTLGDPDVQLTATITVTDADSANLESATITGTSASAGDSYSYVQVGNIAGVQSGDDFLLTGTDTVANYQAALRAVKWSATLEGVQRSFGFVVNDGQLDSNTQSRNANVSDVAPIAPVLANIETGAIDYITGEPPVQVTNTVTVSDADSANMESATITISVAYVEGEDQLAYEGGLQSSWNPTTGVMTLTGTDTLANYETALRAITYNNTNVGAASTDRRTIAFKVNDGGLDSNIVSRFLDVTENANPTLANIEVADIDYTQDDPAVQITNTITVSDSDSANIESAVIEISPGFDPTKDKLAFANTANITGVWSNGVMTLTGTDTLANYETALRSITFESAVPPADPGITQWYRIVQPTALEMLSNITQAKDWTPSVESSATNVPPWTPVVSPAGVWSAANMPAGLSINSTTGQVTGTPTTANLYRWALTFTPTDTTIPACWVIVVQHVAETASVTAIAGGTKTSAQNLTGSKKVFEVEGNINADTMAFYLGCNNCAINLNGFKVTFANNVPSAGTLSNGSFQSGTTSGWDVSGAAGSSVVVGGSLTGRTAPRDGVNSLALVIPNSTKHTIVTTDNLTLVAGEYYEIDMWFAPLVKGNGCTMRVVVGANNTDGLGNTGLESFGPTEFIGPNKDRTGTLTRFTFSANASETVPIQIEMTNTSGAQATFHITDVIPGRPFVHGIASGGNSAQVWAAGGSGSGYKNLIFNGTIEHKDGDISPQSSPVYCSWYTQGPSLDSLTIIGRSHVAENGGQILYTERVNFTITNCTITANCENTTNRDQQWNKVTRVTGDFVSYDCAIHCDSNTITTCQAGFSAVDSDTPARYPSTFKYNDITLESYYTNSFGIYANSGDVTIGGNVMNLTLAVDGCGRGIRWGNGVMLPNNINVRSLPIVAEYTNGWQLGGCYGIQNESWSSSAAALQSEPGSVIEVNGAGGGAAYRSNAGMSTENVTISGLSLTVDGSTPTPPFNLSCWRFDEHDSQSTNLDFLTFDGLSHTATAKTNNLLFDFDSDFDMTMTGELTIRDYHFHIVNDANYTPGTPWSVNSGGINIENPTYENQFTQDEIEAGAAADSRVRIS